MLSILPFQLFALLFLIFGSFIGSDPGLRVGDSLSQLPYDGIDSLGKPALPDLASRNEVSAESPNSDSNQQSSSVPASPQNCQCPPDNNKISSGKRRGRRQLPQFCPQPLVPIGEAHQQQRQNNNGDLKINRGTFRGRNRKTPGPNIVPDFIIPEEREQKRPGDICPPIHPPINGVIPLTIPLCALDQYAKPDNHVGYAGMYALEYSNPWNQFYGCVPFETLWCCTKQIINYNKIPMKHDLNHARKISAWGCLPNDPNHPVHAVYTFEEIPDMVPGIDHLDGILDIPGFDEMQDGDDMLGPNGL